MSHKAQPDYGYRLAQTDLRIVGSEVHVVRSGESLWVIAQQYNNVPIWLLRQYNPDIDFGDVRPRTQLVMPKIQAATAAQPVRSGET